MPLPSTLSRVLLLAVVFTLASAAGGCSWFRGKSPYQLSPENRPLEVPPDLDRPRTDPAMAVPGVAATGGMATAAPQAIDSFVLEDDSPESVWRRLGAALARIDGVQITERAQLLSAYNISYQGQTFLVRAQAEGGNTRVSAVGSDGRAISGGAAGRLLALLQQRLS